MRQIPPATQFPLAFGFAQFSRGERKRNNGFSLIEVALAMGVVAFAFVGILGLLPSGMSTFRKAVDLSVGATIFQKIVDDARQTDFATLTTPPPTATGSEGGNSFQTGFRYFDEGGDEIVPASGMYTPPGSLTPQEKNKAVFYVSTRISTVSGVPVNADPNRQRYETHSLATVTVQVASNPGGSALPINASTNLIDSTGLGGVAITTFSALVARQD